MAINRSKIAIVIPVHNRRDTTIQALKSLSRIDRTGLDIRIFIVDDGSSDGTSDAIRFKFPDVTLIQGSGDLHYAAGTNRGIMRSLEWDPDYVLTMNDDSLFHEAFLKRLVETARTQPHSIVGALLLLWNEPHKVFQVDQKWKTWKGGWVIPEDLTSFNVPKRPFEVECLVGNCVLFPVKAIRENGLMDETRFPHGWGDAQYLMRMRKTGWKLLVDPRSYVWCEPNTFPSPLHELAPKDVLNVLFVNERHPLNLKRQFIARWDSAPTKPKAALAYGIYLTELILKALGLRRTSTEL